MKRSWTSVFLTRATIVGLAVAIFAMNSGPFFAGITKRALQESTGWSWNFTLVDVDFLAGKLLVRDLCLVPPEGSRKEALIADQARVSVGSWGLWNRQMVFDSVEIEVVRSSSIDRLMVMNPQDLWPLDPTKLPVTISAQSASSGRAWLDSFSIANPSLPSPESLNLQKQILAEWETELVQQVALISQAEIQLKKLHESMAEISDNPLRQAAYRIGTATQMQAVSEATSAARNRFQQLVDRRNQDLQRFAGSLDEDLGMIAVAGQQKKFSSDERLANEALIRAGYARFANQICDWACSIRDSVVADGGRNPHQSSDEGRTIMFTGCHSKPRLMVNRLNLDGSSKMGSDHVDFVVVLENLTDRIRLQSNPVRLQMRAQGKYHLLVSGEFQDEMTGELNVTFPDFAVGAISMGHPDSIAIVAQGGSVSFVATIQMKEDLIQGTAEFEHQVAGLKLDSMHLLLASQMDQQRLDRELGKISGFSGRITFGQAGSENMETKVESGPGRQFLSAVSRCLVQSSGLQSQELVTKIEAAKQELELQTGSVIENCSHRLDVISAQARELVAQAETSINPAGLSQEIRR